MRNQADENGRGHIINLASMAGIAPVPGMSIYSASKFALRGYSLTIAHELKQYGVSMAVICPSGADTPLVEPYKHKAQAALIFIAPLLTTEQVVDAIVNRALLKRPTEITLPRARGLMARTRRQVSRRRQHARWLHDAHRPAQSGKPEMMFFQSCGCFL